MTTAKDILTAIRQKDYHAANESFAQVMQAKLADRLAVEKHNIVQAALREDFGATKVCKTCHHAASEHGDEGCDHKGCKCMDLVECEYEPDRLPDRSINEGIREHMPVQEVQRIFDEIGDVQETETLCGVTKLRVNENGQVVSYVSEAFDLDYVNNPYHDVIRKHGYEYTESTGEGDGKVHHYMKGLDRVSVRGKSWMHGEASGSHPNTTRSGADLDRHLTEDSFGAGVWGRELYGKDTTTFGSLNVGDKFTFAHIKASGQPGQIVNTKTGNAKYKDSNGKVWNTGSGSAVKLAEETKKCAECGKPVEGDKGKGPEFCAACQHKLFAQFGETVNEEDQFARQSPYKGRSSFMYGGLDTRCEKCGSIADWRARDKKGNIVGSACKAHKDIVRNELLQKMQGNRKASR